MILIEIDTEELEALIDFQRTMRANALDSLESEEAARRAERIKQLRNIEKEYQ